MRSAIALSIFATVALANMLVEQQEPETAVVKGLTPHFSAWLKANGYGSYNFDRLDLTGGAYGGKSSDSDVIKNKPIIFFHGNSDIAVGTQGLFTGFTKSIDYFLSQGYTKAELYIVTWGDGIQLMASQRTHNQDYLVFLRKFTEAVLAYTGADRFNVISHSMGVSLGRRVIKGGQVNASKTPFNLGPSLADRVDTFIGIAGANYGLINCAFIPMGIPTCNDLNGFFPGDYLGTKGRSKYLAELDDGIKEGTKVYSIFSTTDDLIGYGDLVYGKYTSLW